MPFRQELLDQSVAAGRIRSKPPGASPAHSGTVVERVLALQRSAGNSATTDWIQREEAGGGEGSGGLDAVETALSTVHQGLTAKEMVKAGTLTITEFVEEQGKELLTLSDNGLLAKGLESGVLGPLVMGMGVVSLVEGINQGDPSKAVSGGVDVIGGAATTLAAGVPALAPVAAGAAVFNASKSFTEMGMEASPYDLPGTAADWGDELGSSIQIDYKTGAMKKEGPGLAVGEASTIASSVPVAGIALAYGVKHAAQRLAEPINLDMLIAKAHPEAAAKLELTTTEEPAGPSTDVAHETVPAGPDPWAASTGRGHMTKARARKLRRTLAGFLAGLAAAQAPPLPRKKKRA